MLETTLQQNRSFQRNSVLDDSWENIKNPDKALELLLGIRDEEKNDNYYIVKATCLSKLRRPEEALQVLSYVQNQFRKNVLTIRARCYQAMEQYANAIATFQSISHWKNDKATLLGLACCYEKMGQYDNAITTFQSIFNWKNDKTILLSFARCYQAMEQYDNAIATFQSISHWKNDKITLLGLARCYQAMEQYANAIATFQSISHWKNDKTTLLGLAHCYEEMEQYDNAIITFQSISHWKDDKTTLLSLARCYQGMGQYDNAIATFQSISHWKDDKTMLLGLSHCYEEMGQYDNAIATFQSISHWKNDKTTLLGLACCYEKMGQYDNAITAFQSIFNWKDDKTTLLSFARCYQAMEQYDNAIVAFQSISHWKNDKITLLGLARCYQAMGQYDNAITTFQSVSHWKNDKATLLGLARCYEEMGQYDNAIVTFQSISHWKNDRATLLNFARCYEEMGQYDNAIKTFQSISHWKNDKTTLLGLACCYQEMNWPDKALKTYQIMLEKFPYYQEAYYHFCLYRLGQNDSAIETLLDHAIQKWPYMKQVYLLKAKYESQQLNSIVAFTTLHNVIKQFPYYTEVYIAIILQYLSIGNIAEATAYQDRCHTLFSGHQKLFSRIEKIMNAKNMIKCYGAKYTEFQKENIRIALPDCIYGLFKQLPQDIGECYLVGSTIHTLLRKQPLSKGQDIDFTIITRGVTQLRTKEFSCCPYNSKLYTATIDGFSVDCYMACMSEKPFISHNTLLRDFTFSALYCDMQGNIFDPTGKGVYDFNNKILRTIENPIFCFRDDPIRLLRAIKYIISGFLPTVDVENAMRSWNPDAKFNIPHMLAMIRKHLGQLSYSNKLAYVIELERYQLLQKIFKITPEKTYELTLLNLEEVIKNPIFNITTSHQKSQFFPAQPETFLSAYVKKELQNKNEMTSLKRNELKLQNPKIIASSQAIRKKGNIPTGTTQKVKGKNENKKFKVKKKETQAFVKNVTEKKYNSTEEKQEKIEKFNGLSNQESIGNDVSFWKTPKTVASAAIVAGVVYYTTGCTIL